MNFPNNLKYTKDHEWLRVEDDHAYIGITEFAQKELGDIVFVDIDTLDEELDEEEVFGSVEAVKTVSDLFMPMKGMVVEFNSKLEDQPELINNDPYIGVKVIDGKLTLPRSNGAGIQLNSKIEGLI